MSSPSPVLLPLTASNDIVVNLQCSPAVPCPGMNFAEFNVAPPANTTAKFICVNAVSVEGLPGEFLLDAKACLIVNMFLAPCTTS